MKQKFSFWGELRDLFAYCIGRETFFLTLLSSFSNHLNFHKSVFVCVLSLTKSSKKPDGILEIFQSKFTFHI